MAVPGALRMQYSHHHDKQAQCFVLLNPSVPQINNNRPARRLMRPTSQYHQHKARQDSVDPPPAVELVERALQHRSPL